MNPELRIALVLALIVLLPASGRPAERSELSVTIYNDDIALVRDTREVQLEAGRSVLELPDVSASIQPQTVSFQADDVTVIEQNFDYDLLSPQKLLENAVGQRIRIVRTNPGNGAESSDVAEVLSVNDGAVLRIGPRIEILRADGLPTRVIFDRVPPSLKARPTLSVDLQTPRAGPRSLELRYLTGGLKWSADYVGLFDEDAGALDVDGWITLTNQSGSAYPDALVRLVAGAVNLASLRTGATRWASGRESAGADPSTQPVVGDYYLYDLPGRTTIADRQVKQVAFLAGRGVSGRKVYSYRAASFETMEQPGSVSIAIVFSNAKGSGLAAPLPAGNMRLYARDSRGQSQFIGQDMIPHTPAGSQLAVTIGDAFDVTVQATVRERTAETLLRSGSVSMEYVFRNARSSAARVVFEQAGLPRVWSVSRESLAGRKRDASSHVWEIDVPANGEARLTYTIEWD